LALGCGASGGDQPPAEVVVEAPPVEYAIVDGAELGAQAPRLLAEVTTDEGVRVAFHEVFARDDEAETVSASIIVAEFGHEGSPDPVAEVHASVDVALTSAELWVALTGTPDELPTDLAAHHEREVWLLGRTSTEFLAARRVPLEPVVFAQAKGIEHNLQADSWDDNATFLQPLPAHQHTGVMIGDYQMAGVSTPEPKPFYVYACTGRTSAKTVHKGVLPGLANNCAKTRQTGWVRAGIANVLLNSLPVGVSRAFRVDPYYGPGGGPVGDAWVGMTHFFLDDGQWTVWGWNTATSKGLSLAASRESRAEPYVRLYTGVMTQN